MIKKEKVLNLMVREPIANRWVVTVKDCINPNSVLGKKGQKHISIVFDDNELGARERCYKELVTNVKHLSHDMKSLIS